MSALSKIFGSHSERELKRIYPIADNDVIQVAF